MLLTKSKKFLVLIKQKKAKIWYYVKNLTKNTPFVLHNMNQSGSVLRTPSNIQDSDFRKNSHELFVVNFFCKESISEVWPGSE